MSSGPGYSAASRHPVKVVIINTQHVETDAMSFKSVVQRLTGKDSKIEIHHDNPSSNCSSGSYGTTNFESAATNVQLSSSSSHVPVMSRGLSFKDFDWFLKELPPLDELFRLCSE
ncbi:hypothetical protein ACH5RR_037459 [Cinchona calisaya]|uniref:VQ domain-containing protein n=1 Tax=Cinchona calisaya TaxID=153742 RepID=A0ABD2Y9Z8_9GENT